MIGATNCSDRQSPQSTSQDQNSVHNDIIDRHGVGVGPNTVEALLMVLNQGAAYVECALICGMCSSHPPFGLTQKGALYHRCRDVHVKNSATERVCQTPVP